MYRRLAGAGIALGVALALVGGFLAVQRGGWRSHPSNEGMEVYETATGQQQRDIVMSDGSHILLGARSSITTDWTEKRRTVLPQHGEAPFPGRTRKHASLSGVSR